MIVEQRPRDRMMIQVTGKIEDLLIDYYLKSVYGILFHIRPTLGYAVAVFNLNTDELYMTEYGNDPNRWKSFKYPEQKQELLNELCNESKRRFEESITTIKNW